LTSHATDGQYVHIYRNDLKIGQTIYIFSTPGCLQILKRRIFYCVITGATLFLDHCSKYFVIHDQVSKDEDEIIVGKQTCDPILEAFGISALSYH